MMVMGTGRWVRSRRWTTETVDRSRRPADSLGPRETRLLSKAIGVDDLRFPRLRKPPDARRSGARCALPSLTDVRLVQCLLRPGTADHPAPFDAPPPHSTSFLPSLLRCSRRFARSLLVPRTLRGCSATVGAKLRRGSPRLRSAHSRETRATAPPPGCRRAWSTHGRDSGRGRPLAGN